MMLSDNKINVLTNKLLKELISSKLIIPKEDEVVLRKEIKRTIVNELQIGEEIDSAVKIKLQSFSRKLVEGSVEWDIIYRKFYEEEEIKRGRRR